jgi:hypothetical protein
MELDIRLYVLVQQTYHCHQGSLRTDIVHDSLRPKELHHDLTPVRSRRSSKDAVILFWIPLRHHMALTTALRAPVPVTVTRCFAIVRLHDCFAQGSGIIEGSRSEILDQWPVEIARAV